MLSPRQEHLRTEGRMVQARQKDYPGEQQHQCYNKLPMQRNVTKANEVPDQGLGFFYVYIPNASTQ